MSRMNAAKSRADKTAAKTALAAATPVTHDIVPGKFTDHDWLSMLERDDGDDFIAELLDELYDSVDGIIYTNYIQAQLVPFTVACAKDDILQIIEWQFLFRDEGHILCDVEATDSEAVAAEDDKSDATEAKSNESSDVSVAKRLPRLLSGWVPDEEPMAAATDCWAQGSVPKLVSRPPRTATSMRLLHGSHHNLAALPDTDEDESAEISAEQMPSLLDREISLLDDTALLAEGTAAPADAVAPAELSKDADADTRAHLSEETVHFRLPDTPKLEAFVPSDVVTPSSGKGAGDELQNGSGKQVESVRWKESDFRAEGVCEPDQLKSEEKPPQLSKRNSNGTRSKKTSGDNSAELATVSEKSKMSYTQTKAGGDACLLPSPPLFEKIKPSCLPSNQINTVYCLIDPATEAAEARRLALRNGRRPNVPQSNKPRSADAVTRKLIFDKQSSARDPFRPSLLDTMEISSGVVVRENGRVKKGPKQHRTMSQDADLLRSALRQGLQPVRLQHTMSPLGASELLDSHVPVIKPLMEVAPIPPINQTKHMTPV